MGIVIEHKPIPLSADDSDRRPDQCRIVGEVAVPCLDDLAERAERGLDACGRARATLWIAIQIALTPFFEVNPRQDRGLMRRDVFDESVPLIFRRYDAPRWKRRWCFVTSRSAPADRSK